MIRSLPPLLLPALAGFAIAVTALAGTARAAPGGPIDTLQLGDYACELPGHAAGPAGLRQKESDFSIVNASSYVSGGRRGTYLLTGTTLQMTSGPLKGTRYSKQSDTFLRKLDNDGTPGPLRCVRAVTNNR